MSCGENISNHNTLLGSLLIRGTMDNKRLELEIR